MAPLLPLIKHKSTELYYTSTAWANEKSTHTQGRQTHHESSTGLQSPTTPGYYDLLKNLDIPPANQAQVYRDPLHHDSMSYWENNTYPGQTDPPWIEAQVYRALLHQDTRTYWKIESYPFANQAQVYRALQHRPLLIGQYELMRNQHIPRAERPSMNPAQVCRALLHQDTMTFWEIETYPPANQAQDYRALLAPW